jgi:hypothetical protein
MSSDKFKAVAPEMMFGIADTIAHHRGLVQFFLQLLGKIRVQDENKITLGPPVVRLSLASGMW